MISVLYNKKYYKLNIKKFTPNLEFNDDNLKYYTSTSTYPDVFVKYGNSDSDIDTEQIENIILEIQDKFKDDVDGELAKNLAHDKLGDSLYTLLELDSFFKALSLKLKLNGEKSAKKHFRSYVSSLPRMFDKINQDYSKSDVKNKFKKVKDLKRQSKKHRKLSKEIFNSEIDSLSIELIKMTEYIKDSNLKVLVTCDGRDSAGKGSFIKLVESITNEKIVDHKWFSIPTKYEQRNWFKRYENVLPKEGRLRFFDRSYYNRAVNDPVNGFCTEKQYKKFITNVVPFEERIINDGVIIIKFWFSIEKDTQEYRFALRKASPTKWWKFSSSDAKAVDRYDRFTFYKEQMFAKTSTDDAPWIVVDTNDKKLGQLNGIRYMLSVIDYPNKNVDVIEPYKSKVYKI